MPVAAAVWKVKQMAVVVVETVRVGVTPPASSRCDICFGHVLAVVLSLASSPINHKSLPHSFTILPKPLPLLRRWAQTMARATLSDLGDLSISLWGVQSVLPSEGTVAWGPNMGLLEEPHLL